MMQHIYVSLDKKIYVVNHIKYKLKLHAKRFVWTFCEIRFPTVPLGRHVRHAELGRPNSIPYSIKILKRLSLRKKITLGNYY